MMKKQAPLSSMDTLRTICSSRKRLRYILRLLESGWCKIILFQKCPKTLSRHFKPFLAKCSFLSILLSHREGQAQLRFWKSKSWLFETYSTSKTNPALGELFRPGLFSHIGMPLSIRRLASRQWRFYDGELRASELRASTLRLHSLACQTYNIYNRKIHISYYI